jgi:uncharacterized membrane protein YbhN (UPF0104 family)
MGAYVGLQAVLMWAALHAVGSSLQPHQVLAGFAVERVLTLAVVTPAGTGVAETGATAVLLALGADPVSAVTGVLLYRIFVVALEIPVGGAGIGLWMALRRGRARSAAAV